jgi:hypothetical protein
MAGASPPGLYMPQQKKPSNLRTALILATIALIFFIGVIVKQWWLR